ncbi:HEAT repeat domain-containing protein, partial [Candidatus Peregrinibacteria bacterium]|nr:HEAT repeat domain-containing protein [Candidatus Peregrinibacteria bacterium]
MSKNILHYSSALLFVVIVLALTASISYAQEQPSRDEQIKKAVEQLKSENVRVRIDAIVTLGRLQAKECAKNIAELIKDKGVRETALQVLGELRAKEYAKDIVELLKGEDKDVRKSAIFALGLLQVKEYAKDIADFLKDENAMVRRSAVGALGGLQAREYAKDIVGLLKDEDSQVRAYAVTALWQLQAKEYVKDIAELLKDKDDGVKAGVLFVLSQLQTREYVKDMAKFLKDKNGSVRASAINALMQLQAKGYSKDIAELLKDENNLVRASALTALWRLGTMEYVNGHEKGIAELLKDKNPVVRQNAVEALGRLEAKEYAKDIAELLKDESGGIRVSALTTLWQLQAKEYVNGYAKNISELLKNGYWLVRQNAVAALGRLEAKEYAKDIAELLKDEDKNVRMSAITTLGNLQAVEYVKHIAELLKDENALVRSSVINVLGKLQAMEYVDEYIRNMADLLKDKDGNSRGHAIKTLGQFQAKEYTKNIAEFLKDEEALVRRCAIEALSELHAKEYIKDVLELLKDEDESVRRCAIYALEQLQAKKYAEDIVELLKDKDVRSYAVDTLIKLQETDKKGYSALDVANSLLESGKIYEAICAYAKLVTNPSQVGGYSKEQIEIAKKLQEKPSDFATRMEYVKKHFYSEIAPDFRNPDGALRELDYILTGIVKNNDEKLTVYKMMIYTLGALGKQAEKTAWEDKLLAEFETNADSCAEIILQRGCKAYSEKNFEEALKKFRMVCDKYPNSKSYGGAQFNVGVTLNKLGRNEESISELKKLLGSNVNDRDPSPDIMAMFRNYRPNAARLIASIYFKIGKYKEALEAMTDAQKHYPMWNGCGNCQAQFSWEYQSFIAKCYTKLGETDKAIEIYWGLIRAGGEFYSHPDAPIALTDIYVSQKKVAELKSLVAEELEKKKEKYKKWARNEEDLNRMLERCSESIILQC